MNSIHRSVLSPTSVDFQAEKIVNQEIARTLDTIRTSRQEQEQNKKRQTTAGERPSLPTPEKSRDPNYLLILAEAFGDAFTAISKGTMEQTKDFAELQQLDETMSQSVLRSTKLAIDKQNAAFKIAENIANLEKKAAHLSKVLNDVFIALGVVLVVVTLFATAMSMGAFSALLPEEMTMMSGEMSADGAMEESESGATEMDEVSTDEETGETKFESTKPKSTRFRGLMKTVKSIRRMLNKIKPKQTDSMKLKVFKKLISKAYQAGLGAAFGTPTLITGKEKLETANKLKKAEAAQKEVGHATAIMQENNIYFQFYQKLVQRNSGVIQEESNGAAQVLETFGDITNSYKQISYGLASAV